MSSPVNSKIKKLLEIPQYEQRSHEWFEQRKDKITSSDAGSVLGLNQYDTYESVLFKKCGVKTEFVGNEATQWGQKYEDEAIEKYCRVFNKKNFNFGLISYTDVHPDTKCKWLAGSPDGIAEDLDYPNEYEPILLEVKCPFKRKIITNKCPAYYYPQVQLNLFITGLTIGDYIEYDPRKDELNVVRIFKDLNWLETNLPKLEKFWMDVEHYRGIGIDKHPKFKREISI
jgi:putative phage-type endonuclease